MPAKVKAPSSGANGKGKGKGKGTAKGNAKVGANGWDEKPQGHKGEILAIAASEDGQYVVTGGRDRLVGVWRADGAGGQVEWVAGIRGHKDAVTVRVLILHIPRHILPCHRFALGSIIPVFLLTLFTQDFDSTQTLPKPHLTSRA
jgi:WD40 repeat protein